MVRRVMLAWRELTGGRGRGRDSCRRTLVACSGGADSSGLAIALAAGLSGPETLLTIAHVVHDMRPEAEALADRDAAAALADWLGVPFVQATVRARRARGNLEATSRRLRYAAFARLAREEACPFVATAHHADDQLETVLMGLIRGAGPAGLGGVHPRRPLNARRTLIRPALGLARTDLREICQAAGWRWREDATNDDVSRVRGALRATVIPAIKALRPGVEERGAQAAAMFSQIHRLLEREAGALISNATRERTPDRLLLDRGSLRHQPPVVLGEMLRRASAQVGTRKGRDRLGHEKLMQVAAAIADETTEPRVFGWPGVEVRVSAGVIELRGVV